MVMLFIKLPNMWKSKMQKTTALSTAEAEYYSASMAGCEDLDLLLHMRHQERVRAAAVGTPHY